MGVHDAAGDHDFVLAGVGVEMRLDVEGHHHKRGFTRQAPARALVGREDIDIGDVIDMSLELAPRDLFNATSKLSCR